MLTNCKSWVVLQQYPTKHQSLLFFYTNKN
jgi:hypothetical protein